MDDFTICKKIAEIEGAYELLLGSDKSVTALFDDPSRTHFDFNPLTDDALCFQLMIKHTVVLEYCIPEHGYFTSIDGEFDTGNQTSANKCICLTIIEANKND